MPKCGQYNLTVSGVEKSPNQLQKLGDELNLKLPPFAHLKQVSEGPTFVRLGVDESDSTCKDLDSEEATYTVQCGSLIRRHLKRNETMYVGNLFPYGTVYGCTYLAEGDDEGYQPIHLSIHPAPPPRITFSANDETYIDDFCLMILIMLTMFLMSGFI